MSAGNFQDLQVHLGHEIECVSYGNKDIGNQNVAIECETCHEVLMDFDKDG